MTKKKSLKTIENLISHNLISEKDKEDLGKVVARYALSVTPTMGQQIQNEPNGAIARQFLPSREELHHTPQEHADPIGDNAFSPIDGLVHRYPDRVLFKITNVCAVYCRFCFRREMVGIKGGSMLPQDSIDKALSYIAQHTDIWEVIFSGGDPFILSPRRLGLILEQLSTIPHVKIIRFHTRVPVVAPERITKPLIAALKKAKKTIYIALHANHASEFSQNSRNACARLIDAGFPMISQSVLLKGVNNSVEALEELMRAFVETRIKPYYLHHPDFAPGTSHFRLSMSEGQQLVKQLRGRVSGLCQPHYMLDIPGGHGKVPLGLCAVTYHPETDEWRVEDPKGNKHSYPA